MDLAMTMGLTLFGIFTGGTAWFLAAVSRSHRSSRLVRLEVSSEVDGDAPVD